LKLFQQNYDEKKRKKAKKNKKNLIKKWPNGD